jgi:serine/threonine protein kinase
VNTKLCPTCATPIPDTAPGGFCPACLLRDAAEPPPTGRAAPSLEDVAAAFPALEILMLIGQGGMGSVYKVRQPNLDRVVALKLLAPELSRDPAFAERFAREARVLGKLNHPNIVSVYEHGRSDGRDEKDGRDSKDGRDGGFYYLIMEYVDGVNLRQAMRAGRFTPQQALGIVPGICDALAAAHAQGIWHRDIKPENILLDQRGGVKIADFGIARMVGDQTRNFTLTGTGNALGSIAYMAPEQHESPHTVDHRADIYSLGVVIYEMLTGELPLGRFPAPSQRAAVSARIDEIVFQTLEKERELRQQSATEVKTDVFRATTPAEPVDPSNTIQTGQPSKQTLWSLGLLLLGTVLFGLGAALLPRHDFYSNDTSGLQFIGGLMIAVGGVSFVAGYAGVWYSLWEMRRGLRSHEWRSLLEAVAILPMLIKGWKWWTEHSPISQRWTFALLLLVGPSVPLIAWFANDHPLLGSWELPTGFYASGLVVLIAVFTFGKFIWSSLLTEDCYPNKAHRIALALLAVACAGITVWFQQPPEPPPRAWASTYDSWNLILSHGVLCGASGLAALLLLFAPRHWGWIGLILCAVPLGWGMLTKEIPPTTSSVFDGPFEDPITDVWLEDAGPAAGDWFAKFHFLQRLEKVKRLVLVGREDHVRVWDDKLVQSELNPSAVSLGGKIYNVTQGAVFAVTEKQVRQFPHGSPKELDDEFVLGYAKRFHNAQLPETKPQVLTRIIPSAPPRSPNALSGQGKIEKVSIGKITAFTIHCGPATLFTIIGEGGTSGHQMESPQFSNGASTIGPNSWVNLGSLTINFTASESTSAVIAGRNYDLTKGRVFHVAKEGITQMPLDCPMELTSEIVNHLASKLEPTK